MSDFDKIEEQEQVLNCYNKNIIVSASAGSGKTSVMVRKIVDYLVNQNIKVKELLVLTYTNSSASEMKQRLIGEMTKCAENNPQLLEQIDDVPLADISTFDSFCQKLVKKYFYALEIDPGFNILEGTKQIELKQKAIKKAIKNYSKKHPNNYFELFNSYANKLPHVHSKAVGSKKQPTEVVEGK